MKRPWSIWWTDSWGRRRKRPFHPRVNRWTGKPHERAREIARRQRQGAR